jgi:hypothetical protein
MTLYADADTRECWRINYGFFNLEAAQDAADYWNRCGGSPPGCVLALAHAIEQIDADEELMRQALEALEIVQLRYTNNRHVVDAVKALRERLGAEHA